MGGNFGRLHLPHGGVAMDDGSALFFPTGRVRGYHSAMKDDRSTPFQWFLLIVEIAPLVVFSYLGRFGFAFPQRFHIAAGLAIVCTVFLILRRWPFNPLLVAANIWLCLEALMLGSGIGILAQLSETLQESAFFATLLIVGLGFLVLSPEGLFARGGSAPDQTRQGSIVLVTLIAASLIWSFFWRGNEMIAAVIPATTLFLVQQFWPRKQSA